ncbi:MAG: ferritin family protein [Dehalococcoidia bacterium]|nr:ferritin family protein [Dehalococcoidia bacterium]
MDTHDRLLEALRTAEQMEVDGKAFYLKMTEASVNRRGKELFRVLASEEDVHRDDFRRIYEAVRDNRPAPSARTICADITRIHRLFSQAAPDLEPDITAAAEELSAIDTAIRMEEEGIDYYKKLEAGETDPSVKRFYKALVEQEENHRAALIDYRSYVLDPEGWLVSKTRPSAGVCYTPRATGEASEMEW